MEIPKIHEGEYRFCLIMWEHEPISAAQLVKLCQEQLGWKRTTTYTVIKRLGERGILKNEDGIVTALVSKDEAQACEIDELVEREKKIDLLKWNWLEDEVFFHYFTIERIFVFLLRLEMIGRWISLDKEKGSELFRQLIQSLKEQVQIPEEFRK